MRITVSVDSTGQIVSADIPGELSLADFRAYLEAETTIEPTKQTLILNGKSLHEEKKTLQELGIIDDDLIMLSVRTVADADAGPRSVAGSTSDPEITAVETRIEMMRQQLLSNPQMVEQIRSQQPELHAALNDPTRFKDAMIQQIEQHNLGNGGGNQEELRRLYENPDDPANQARILDIIRQEQIQENMELAYNITPESFTTVDMLYINIVINGEKVQAFVDSGAQTTIISPRLAEKVGIDRLIDRRYRGIAQGVGQQTIEGKIHSVPITIGDSKIEIPCSFTVLDTSVDLLFGLDMLKRHKCVIDLDKNVLVVGKSIETKFLDASELPSNGIFGKSGGTIGSQLGGNIFSDAPMATRTTATASVRSKPANSAAAEAAAKRQNTGVSPSASDVSSSTSTYKPKPEDIDHLIGLGFSKTEAISALKMTEGNVELAASLLFG
ncbi:hypothetical protein G9P44_004751 [Scheffersomyces stipitis]|nr:hypothetical protein G9P44_004751 [Scheffersomyces stipitis]